MDLLTNMNTPPSTPTSIDAVAQISDVSDRPWTPVRFFADRNFLIDEFLSKSGMSVNVVQHMANQTHPGSYEFAVATNCLDLLSKMSHGFKIEVGYDPFEPAEEDIRIFGTSEAIKKAQINTLNNAAEAICNGWGHGPAKCYRMIINEAGLDLELERAIVSWKIQVIYPHDHLQTYLLIMPSIPTQEQF